MQIKTAQELDKLIREKELSEAFKTATEGLDSRTAEYDYAAANFLLKKYGRYDEDTNQIIFESSVDPDAAERASKIFSSILTENRTSAQFQRIASTNRKSYHTDTSNFLDSDFFLGYLLYQQNTSPLTVYLISESDSNMILGYETASVADELAPAFFNAEKITLNGLTDVAVSMGKFGYTLLNESASATSNVLENVGNGVAEADLGGCVPS